MQWQMHTWAGSISAAYLIAPQWQEPEIFM
jgi:hypothetical protein